MTTPSEYVRPQTAQQAALREIRRWLIAGRLKPGDQVIQDVVASELGVSVVPIREALKTLETEGQLKYIPQRGFFVNELSREELLELCEIRSALEAMAVDRALAHVSQSDIQEMRDLITRMEVADKAGDVVEMIRLDRRFHFAVFEAAGLDQLARIITLTWDQSDPYRAAFFNNPEHRTTNHREHRKILTAVRKRDAATLKHLLDEHRLGPVRRLSQLVDDVDVSAAAE